MTIYYPLSQSAQQTQSSGFYFKGKSLRLSSCPILPPNFQYLESRLWNNNLCGAEMEYYQLFDEDDIIPIQLHLTDLINVDIENPVYGFHTSVSTNHYVKVSLYDLQGNLIDDEINGFCDDFYVDHGSLGSFQTFFVNCDHIATDGFYLTVETYDQNGNVATSIISEPWKRVTNQDTLLFDGYYGNRDGYNRYYKSDDVPFYHSFRCEAAIWLNGTGAELSEADNNTIVSVDIAETYNLQAWLLPPYAQRLLSIACFAQTTQITDSIELNTYTNFDSLNKENGTGRMFFIETSCNRITEIDHYEC